MKRRALMLARPYRSCAAAAWAAAFVLTPAVVLAAADALAQERLLPSAPLQVRNLSPVTQLFGLPRALGGIAEPGGVDVALRVEHSNNFAAAVHGDTAVLFDGSTTVTSLGLRGAVGERWEWGIELPYVYHDGGFTDGFIEGFHDLFGFPDGSRGAVSRQRLDYRVVHRGKEVVRVTDAGGGLGDVRLGLGYRLLDAPGRHAVLRGLVELPTGDAADLTGSGGPDIALSAELADARWLQAVNVTVTLAAGVTFPGDSDLGLPQPDAVGSAHLGLHHPLTRRVVLRAQLDGHTDVVDAGWAALGGAALLGTLGGSLRLTPALDLDLALVEDLTPDRAPDVVFLTSLRARF